MLVVFATGCGTGGEFSQSVQPGSQGDTPAIPVASARPATPPAPVPPAPTGGTPAPAPTLVSPGTVTLADAGSTVRLRRGERLHVRLSNGSGTWEPPSADGEAVRRIEASGGYPSREAAQATFLAVADGTATITSRTDYPCLHAHPPCAIAQRIWLVRVIVSN